MPGWQSGVGDSYPPPAKGTRDEREACEKHLSPISRSELSERLGESKPFLLIEALRPEEYAKGHLPGAINVPVDQIERTVPSLVPGRAAEIVVYCASAEC